MSNIINHDNELLPTNYGRLFCWSSSKSTSAIDRPETFRNDVHNGQTLSRIRKHREEGQFCDVTLVAGADGTRVTAHRLVLSSASDYFTAMFNSRMKEATDREITIHNVRGDVLEALVNYCYTSTIRIRGNNVEAIYLCAHLMHFKELLDACSQFLIHHLHPSNCLQIMMFLERMGNNYVLERAKAYISEHFAEVIHHTEFMLLSLDELTMLWQENHIINEKDKLNAVKNWLDYDPCNRRAYLPFLLQLINMNLLEPAFLVDVVEPLIEGDPDSEKMFTQALKWHLLPERQRHMDDEINSRIPKLDEYILVVGLNLVNCVASFVEYYNPKNSTRNLLYKMNDKRERFQVALIKDKIFIIGGMIEARTLATMSSLHLKSGLWSQNFPMIKERHSFGVAVLHGFLYAIGGHNGTAYLNSVERWDPTTGQWENVASMGVSRCGLGIAVLNGSLYAVGGRNAASYLRTVERYNPITNQWCACAPLVHARTTVGVTANKHFVYAIGGNVGPTERLNSIERYDPRSDSWQVVAQLSNARDAVAACVFGERILAIAGFDGTNYLTAVEQYDPETNNVTKLAPLHERKRTAFALVLS